MCDPIIDKSENIEIEEFTKAVVEEYLRTPPTFSRYPLRHYNQLEVSFAEGTVRILLNRLHVPTTYTAVTVFGGYTGQFAKCLRSLGMKVVFTDPLEEWVQEALKSGFEAYRYSAAQIPRDLLERTDLFATFECYPALAGETGIYNVLRFMASKFGILFAESRKTTAEIDKEGEGPLARLKNSFLPYSKVYSITRTFRESEDLRLYHLCTNNSDRETIKTDCKVMKLVYDSFLNKTCLNQTNIAGLDGKTRYSYEELLRSLRRILSLYRFHIPNVLAMYFPKNMFRVYSKEFTIDKDLCLDI